MRKNELVSVDTVFAEFDNLLLCSTTYTNNIPLLSVNQSSFLHIVINISVLQDSEGAFGSLHQ